MKRFIKYAAPLLAVFLVLLGGGPARGDETLSLPAEAAPEPHLFQTFIGGDIWLRGFYKRNVTDASNDTYDKAHYLQGRFRLNFETIFAERTRAHISIDFLNSELSSLNAPLYSGDSVMDDDDRGFYTFGSNPYGAASPVIGVREAWLQIEFPYNIELKGGRTRFRLGNGIVLDQPQDMVLLSLFLNRLRLQLGYAKIWDTQGGSTLWAFSNMSSGTTYRCATTAECRPYPENRQLRTLMDEVADRLSSNDTDAVYFTVDFDVTETAGGGLFAAFLNDQESFAAGFFLDNERLINKTGVRVGALGAHFNAELWGLHIRGETDFLFGDVNIGAHAFDVDTGDIGVEDPFTEYQGQRLFGWNIYLDAYQPFDRGRIGATFGRGMGDGRRNVVPKRISQIGSDFQLMNILTDEISPFGLSNITILKGYGEYYLTDKLFMRMAMAPAWRTATGTDDPDTAINEGGKFLGFEVDAGFTYQFTDYLTFYADSGWLIPGAGIEALNWQMNRQDLNGDGLVDANDIPKSDDLAVELTTGVRLEF